MQSIQHFIDIWPGNFALQLVYLLSSITFIIGLKRLSSPDSARKGNLLAAAGMGLAILGTIFLHRTPISADGSEGFRPIGNLVWIFGAIGLGTVVGWMMAMRVKMTAMPQMVSFFNGMGGACAALIGLIEYRGLAAHGGVADAGFLLIIYLGVWIGSVSFAGSMIAYGKLEERIKDFGGRSLQMVNLLFLAALIGAMVFGIARPEAVPALPWIVAAGSLLYGVLFVLPIGGADMPVVISLLNSFTGIAAALGGFLYNNQVMLTGGILVGSAGTILTILMCKAMNRSLLNVLIGSFGSKGGAAGATGEQVVKEISATDAAILCAYAQRVSIVPGYGLAVAQAQHTCHEFEKQLSEKGVEVTYAIHPVAGRMPGHMNVLLAEADVAYPKMLEMDDANPQMPNTDVVIVIGANDVVNPAAENDPSSPIYGMPIIHVDKSRNVIVMKRSMGKGYAGIENQLFFGKNTRMLFGDAKSSLEKLVSEVKAL
ncbi:MAG: NAD(P)(+) transhydrogenase (Re/Si-specific) subunit beta [Bacteroidetes bacterium]|nr:NAD(P)(+) transhydrogenase (Re/Si-specific) subunit beta [Bacteroidota bacterium]